MGKKIKEINFNMNIGDIGRVFKYVTQGEIVHFELDDVYIVNKKHYENLQRIKEELDSIPIPQDFKAELLSFLLDKHSKRQKIS